jgi:CDP-diacylglycerol--serine O-phosphatidyltransferase
VLWGIAVLYMLCAVLRLARFNVNKNDDQWTGSFCGLPSPAAAATIASLVVIGPGLMRWTRPEAADMVRFIAEFLLDVSVYCLPLVTFAVACLMVSRVRYPKLGAMFQGKRSYRHLVNLIFCLVAVFAVHELALPLIMLGYAAGAPLRAFWNRFILRRSPETAVTSVTQT